MMKKVIIWIVVVIVLYVVWMSLAIYLADKNNEKFINSKSWDERLCLNWIVKLKEQEQVLFKTIETTTWEDNMEIIGWKCSYQWKETEYFCIRDLDMNKAFYQVSLWGKIIFEDFSRLSKDKI